MKSRALLLAAAMCAAANLPADTVQVFAGKYNVTGCWNAEGASLVADAEGKDAEATVTTPGAGACHCWARMLVGSSCTVDIGGSVFKPEAKGEKDKFVWVKLGIVAMPAGYTAIMLRQNGKVKSAVAEIVLTMDAEWDPVSSANANKP